MKPIWSVEQINYETSCVSPLHRPNKRGAVHSQCAKYFKFAATECKRLTFR
jgi:hypothetical protein